MVTIILLYTFYYIIDIRVIIIGVGSGWALQYVSCLTESDDDIIHVADFTQDDFDDFFGVLGGILCPISLDFKVTEIKRKTNTDCFNCKTNETYKFVEIWNKGIPFDPSRIILDGIITGTAPTGYNILQSQYLVFYYNKNGLINNKNNKSIYIPCGIGENCTDYGWSCCFHDTLVK